MNDVILVHLLSYKKEKENFHDNNSEYVNYIQDLLFENVDDSLT